MVIGRSAMNRQDITLQISDLSINIQVRENPRSKRLSLRLHPSQNMIYLTRPSHAMPHEIMAFIEKSRGWLLKVCSHLEQNTPLVQGNQIPILGVPHLIRYSYQESPSVTADNQVIEVKGFDPIIVPGLTKDWLRSHIYKYVTETSQKFAAQIGKQVTSINIKDTSSRWGSCSRDGNLAYSWRLVFAGLEVAEYVCAHEVAHLIEMNHSPAFWSIVKDLCPQFKHHRRWLKEHGKILFTYG